MPAAPIIDFKDITPEGDHNHIDGIERPYDFVDIERLIEDFIAAVAERRKT